MTQSLKFSVFVLLGAAGVFAGLAILAAACAHATVVVDGAPAPVKVVTEQGLPIQAWIMIGLAALGSLRGLVHGVAELVGFIAKRTPNTKDDAIHDKLDKLADGVDEIYAAVRGVVGGGTTVVNVQPAVPKDPQSGRVSVGMAAWIAACTLAGALAGSALCGCTAAKHKATETGHTVIDCAKADQPAIVSLLSQLAIGAVRLATGGQTNWDALEALAETKGVEVGGCALATLVAEYLKPGKDTGPGTVSRSLVAEPDPAVVALERMRAKSGGVRWSVEARK